MDQIRRLLDRLNLRQKITLAAAIAAVAGSLFLFVRWNTERNFRPLFSNLAPEDAGQITSRLRERGVEFRISEAGNTVSVPSEKVAELRLELAGEGLPKSGRIGFELFDKTNLAITDFQEQVNYHRALEGELERSIMSLAEVELARVHITFQKDSVFAESRQPAKASVMLKLRPGARLAAQSVPAITHLAASAVEGLQPDYVSVMDTEGRLLNRPKKHLRPGEPEPDDAQIEFRQKIERDLLAKINATLEPLVGPDHFRASVSAEVDFSSGEHSEETFDPTRSVMTNQQKTEDVSGSVQAGGVPGAASNLPRPTSRPGESGKSVARRTENISYQSTRSVKRMLIPQGLLKRVSLSVLVDHGLRWEGAGQNAKRIVEPPAPEKLKKIADLVSAAVGLQTQRGDQITVESVPFEATLTALPPADLGAPAPATGGGWPGWVPAPLRNSIIWLGLAALAVVAVGFGFIRKRKKVAAVAQSTIAGAEGPAPQRELPAGKSIEDQLAAHAQRQLESDAEALKSLKLPEAAPHKAEVLTRHIAEYAKKDAAAIAQVLRTWLQDDVLAK